jgi:hypothetical protein
MKRRITRVELLRIVGNDENLLELLCEEGLVRHTVPDTEELEAARLAHTLMHELDVNWPGVEIILRMRTEMLDMRRQIAELLELLKRAES